MKESQNKPLQSWLKGFHVIKTFRIIKEKVSETEF